MKQFSALLIAAAVAFSAAAGVTNGKPLKRVDPADAARVKIEKPGMRHGTRDRRDAQQSLNATPLQTMKWGTSNHATAIKYATSYMWDFEDESQLSDWSAIDNDGDGFNWSYYNSEGVTAHSGTGIVTSESYSNDYGALTPDNWLISPMVELKGTLVFYAAGQDPAFARETFAVYAAVGEPESIEDFVKISPDYTTNGTMKEYIIDLSEFDGQQGYIAFRHYNSTDQFRLNIDDVTITTEEVTPEPEPEDPTVIYEIPEGCQTTTYYRNSGTLLEHWLIGIYARETAGKFKIAIDPQTNDAYIQNPIWAYESLNSWIKGTLDPATGIITVPTGQYIGWDEAEGYGLQLMWGSSYVYSQGADPETGEETFFMGTEIDERTTEFYIQIDGDQVYLLDTEGNVHAEFPEWGNATGLMLVWSDDKTWAAFEFANRNSDGSAKPFGDLAIIVPAVPANPTADDFEDGGNENGYTKFYFTLPEVDIDGNKIDFELVSYSLWVDNGNGPEIYVFTEEDYITDLQGMGELTEIPYSIFYGGYDFFDYMVYLYRTNAPGYEPLFTENIGIQAHYTVDGIKNSSDIAWLYESHSAVNEVNAGKTIQSVRYYNMAGQQVAQPSGMTIRVTTYTDGTTSTAKVIK